MRDLLKAGACADWLRELGLDAWAAELPQQLERLVFAREHGDMARWQAALDALPPVVFEAFSLDEPAIRLGPAGPDSGTQSVELEQALQALHPWRKGPFSLHGCALDSEWRSDLKWSRVSPHLAPLNGGRVLDVGCGNGYYAWRLLGAGAGKVLGIDPTLLFFMQDQAIRKLMRANAQTDALAKRFLMLPIGIEHLPAGLRAFDLVMSMGVLYHRRSPLDHLVELRDALRPGGQLLLETLVTEGPEGYSLLPAGRYAKMRNVWFIPSVPTLEAWLRRLGLCEVTSVDVTATTGQEQRSTAWMRFESLADFLDPADPTRTVEGHPAPVRAVVSAIAPG